MPVDYYYHRFEKMTVRFTCPYCGFTTSKMVNVESAPEKGDTVEAECGSCGGDFQLTYKGGEVFSIVEGGDE